MKVGSLFWMTRILQSIEAPAQWRRSSARRRSWTEGLFARIWLRNGRSLRYSSASMKNIEDEKSSDVNGTGYRKF